ncbi:hypothetical protein [Puia dinghuensis]|uniref:Uncharacterized protein n=1 Tax=Puia dinghuensis TaxID=1792502 RepID=A0A8J2XQE7_9BACT|nr:hypothetical protein [Puia dinghuensis]GGA92455.1 hypothetical protein GCM10011511_14810 [Puia dinghuensis]
MNLEPILFANNLQSTTYKDVDGRPLHYVYTIDILIKGCFIEYLLTPAEESNTIKTTVTVILINDEASFRFVILATEKALDSILLSNVIVNLALHIQSLPQPGESMDLHKALLDFAHNVSSSEDEKTEADRKSKFDFDRKVYDYILSLITTKKQNLD